MQSISVMTIVNKTEKNKSVIVIFVDKKDGHNLQPWGFRSWYMVEISFSLKIYMHIFSDRCIKIIEKNQIQIERLQLKWGQKTCRPQFIEEKVFKWKSYRYCIFEKKIASESLEIKRTFKNWTWDHW